MSQDISSIKVTQISNGIFHLKGAFGLTEQQTILDEIRNLCIQQPHKFKFSRPLPPTAFELDRAETQSNTMKDFVEKTSCYSLEVPASDAPDIVKTHVPIQMQTIMANSH